ncbi:hypothetical protein [Microbacterium testaceum]|uniref:hypothetical protein n=1 Tax=Microbacterium testaceum TaxID=2033 RepID=UPI0022E84C24|nr:hypothetical protein [Microbacterium testaceum]
MTEQQILDDLVSSWVSLALEYAQGAPDLTTIYIYVSSERGSVYPEMFFEQGGEIRYPSDVVGVDTGVERVRSVHRFQFEDLRAAEAKFSEIGVPQPTEYRITFDVATRRTDMSLSRELIYANDPVKVPERGLQYWLGDRAPQPF